MLDYLLERLAHGFIPVTNMKLCLSQQTLGPKKKNVKNILEYSAYNRGKETIKKKKKNRQTMSEKLLPLCQIILI
jgi:hypothetical protein